MARADNPATRGFWRGVLAGLAVASAIALGLAIAFPPTIFHDPQVVPEAQVAPKETATPDAAAAPGAPDPGGALLRPPGAPLIGERPAADAPPERETLAPPAIPNVDDGGPSGSPSLAPQG